LKGRDEMQTIEERGKNNFLKAAMLTEIRSRGKGFRSEE
jgi:hypothetical protein